MEPIHIETLKAASAAAEVCHVLRQTSSPWLVWSANDEGYLMVPASSLTARSVRKYYAETIAGEFIAASSAEVVTAALIRARHNAALRNPCRDAERRAYEAKYKRERRAMARAAA